MQENGNFKILPQVSKLAPAKISIILADFDVVYAWCRFYFEVSQLVQSLPELIHHQSKVVDVLCKQIVSVEAQDLQTYFTLVSVLAR